MPVEIDAPDEITYTSGRGGGFTIKLRGDLDEYEAFHLDREGNHKEIVLEAEASPLPSELHIPGTEGQQQANVTVEAHRGTEHPCIVVDRTVTLKLLDENQDVLATDEIELHG